MEVYQSPVSGVVMRRTIVTPQTYPWAGQSLLVTYFWQAAEIAQLEWPPYNNSLERT